MAVTSSGQIGLSSDIGSAAGYPTSVQKRMGQAMIRAITGAASNTQQSMSSYYGGPNTAKYWRWYITARRGADNAGIQASIFQPCEVNTVTMPPTYSNPNGSSPANEQVGNLFDNSQSTKFLDFNFGGSATNVNNGFTDVRFEFGGNQQLRRYRWWTANDAINRDPISWRVENSYNGTDYVVQETVTNYGTTTSRRVLAYDTGANQTF